ncbi:hypothetical protein [Tenacibaculum amylolyticum]|uniref:hypothetical protein n=1 Tax=Tenacibaculum amylolyticum TaxID=104269 RepID=UPI0038939A87
MPTSNKRIEKMLFQSILDNLYPENEPLEMIGDLAFDNIDILVNKYFDDNFSQLIINSIEPQTDLRKIALIFEVLVWSTPDNGEKMDSDTKNWLESKDLTKIKCMLFRHDWLPLNQNWEKLSKEIILMNSKLKNLIEYYTDELLYWEKNQGRRTELLINIVNTTVKLA